MAFLTDIHAAPKQNNIVALFGTLKADFVNYRAYRKTIAELSKLTSHELDDLGLNRSGINASARDAVYGY